MTRCALIFLLAGLACANCFAGTTVYVSDHGSDQNAGTAGEPLATLEKARDRVRSASKIDKSAGPFVIDLQGDFYLDHSFALTGEDSGVEGQPVLYRASADRPARLLGEKRVTNFRPVTDSAILDRIDPVARPHLLQADLKMLGIVDFGELKIRGIHNQADCPLELFASGHAMPLAQYPNVGWLTVDTLPAGETGDRITTQSDRLTRWQHAPDAWAYGYWKYGWADTYLPIVSVNAEAKEIRLGATPYYGLAEKQRFRILNVLEEIDSPGEWYLDRRNGTLYFWPPDAAAASTAAVSVLNQPLITVKGASFVSFANIEIGCTRNSGVVIEGGTHVTFTHCTIHSVGGDGVTIKDGTQNKIVSSTIRDCGKGGISLNGGDRSTLTPSGNAAENDEISDFGRIYHTYQPAISLDGVGNRAAHNHIHNAPHQAIAFSGNDNVMEYNDIHDVMLETDDAGAIYAGRDWTMRGNVIANNFIHHNGPAFAEQPKPSKDPALVPGPLHVGGVVAVYLDDLATGVLVENNILEDADLAVEIGGGRDNIVKNNVVIDSQTGVWIDGRGETWAKAETSPGGSHRMYEKLTDVHFDRPPYSVRYPELKNILNESPQEPRGNLVTTNIFVDVKNPVYANDDIAKALIHPEKTATLQLPPTPRGLRLVDSLPDATLQQIGFKRILVNQIGVVK
jgi:hypothetical protein